MAILGIVVLKEMHTFRAIVNGLVTNEQDDPIPGAKVVFFHPNTDSIEYDIEGTTDQSGFYSLVLPTVNVALDSSPSYNRNVIISAKGYTTARTFIKMNKGSNPNCNYTLKKNQIE